MWPKSIWPVLSYPSRLQGEWRFLLCRQRMSLYGVGYVVRVPASLQPWNPVGYHWPVTSPVRMSFVSMNELNVCGLKPCSSSVLFDASTSWKGTPGPQSNAAYCLGGFCGVAWAVRSCVSPSSVTAFLSTWCHRGAFNISQSACIGRRKLKTYSSSSEVSTY